MNDECETCLQAVVCTKNRDRKAEEAKAEEEQKASKTLEEILSQNTCVCKELLGRDAECFCGFARSSKECLNEGPSEEQRETESSDNISQHEETAKENEGSNDKPQAPTS